MTTNRKLYWACFALVLLFASKQKTVNAGPYDCYGATLEFLYSGYDVSCDSTTQQMMCEAFCDLCFNTACLDPKLSSCVEYTYDIGACANID